MPLISQFFGILIYMYRDEHNPPHFHAIYNDYEAEILINPISIRKGKLPKRAQSMVYEWAAENQMLLLEDWERAHNMQDLIKIPPLE